MKVLAIIPARGGSKGVPRKNIKMLGGKPLIEWTITEALKCKDILSKIVVSTDNFEIAEISKSVGAEVPFIRPAELAQDTTKTLPVIQHAINFVEKQESLFYDAVMILQPTVPFRNEADIREAIEIISNKDCDSVISVARVYSHHPILMKKIHDNYLTPYYMPEIEGTRRQDFSPAAYIRNGAIYLSNRDNIIINNTIWGKQIRPLIMPEDRSVNIDSEIDFLVCEAMCLKK